MCILILFYLWFDKISFFILLGTVRLLVKDCLYVWLFHNQHTPSLLEERSLQEPKESCCTGSMLKVESEVYAVPKFRSHEEDSLSKCFARF